ncbi:MAG: threonylcarbamoyl-AMP synthase [Elusimicrobia bacterium]|nr:threonylcarbamoyl-AMP synthase [Elusimicrobiota bacterium]
MKKNIVQAAQAVRRGELIIFPTETVYALAANGLDPKAKSKIYAAKGRDFSKPLQLLLADTRDLPRFVEPSDLTLKTGRLLRHFWPGPLTAVFRAGPLGVILTGKATIGVRIPDHPLALKIIKKSKLPVMATSANKSGGPEPVSGRHVPAALKKAAKWVIMEPGPTKFTAPSTVLDLTIFPPQILREGAISRRMIEKWL